MAKKEKKEAGFLGSLKEPLSTMMLNFTKNTLSNITSELKERFNDFQEKMTRAAYAAALFLFSVLFLLLSAVFLMNEYTRLSFGWCFLIIGLILLVISLFFRLSIKNKR